MLICVYLRISKTTGPIWLSFTVKLQKYFYISNYWGGTFILPRKLPLKKKNTKKGKKFFFFKLRLKVEWSTSPHITLVRVLETCLLVLIKLTLNDWLVLLWQLNNSSFWCCFFKTHSQKWYPPPIFKFSTHFLNGYIVLDLEL